MGSLGKMTDEDLVHIHRLRHRDLEQFVTDVWRPIAHREETAILWPDRTKYSKQLDKHAETYDRLATSRADTYNELARRGFTPRDIRKVESRLPENKVEVDRLLKKRGA